MRETSVLRTARVIAAVAYAALCARTVLAATLPNEIPGTEIAVTARGACGPFFRPGAWMVLRVTVVNTGDPFQASVRVRETRGGAAALFIGAQQSTIARGTNSFELLLAPGDPSAGTALEILSSGEGKVVFRSALSRMLRPLAREERLVLVVGATAVRVRGDDGARVWALEPGEMPSTREAYGSVDLLVIGTAPRSAMSVAQARASADYLLGGGRIVFTSLHAFWTFAPVIFEVRQDFNEPLTTLTHFRKRVGTDAGLRVLDFSLGFGRGAVLASAQAGKSPWLAAELAKLLGDDNFLAPTRAGALVDAGAFGALEAERPFAQAGRRARTVAIVGALLATLCAALVAGKRRAVAGGVLGGAVVAWAIVASMIWHEPVAAARIIRVRALSADGRAEVVTDTVGFVAFEREATLAFETETGPPLPVARRPGRAFAEPFVWTKRTGGVDAWSLSALRVYPTDPYLVRATSARAISPAGETLRARVMTEGARAQVTTLPGGAIKLSCADDLPRDVRYLLERFAPPCTELAWVWVEGAPEGTSAPECDTAPGSGTLLIAGIPAASESD